MDETTTHAGVDEAAGGQADQSQSSTTTPPAPEDNQGTDTTKTGDDTAAASTASTDGAADKGDAPGDDAHAPKLDADLDEWAEKRGYGKLETDKERRIAQDARNNQREFSRDRAAKKNADQLTDAVKAATPKVDKPDGADDGDPLEKDVAGIKADLDNERALRQRSEYFVDQAVTDDESKMMGEILKEKVDRASARGPEAAQAALAFWTDPANLEDWHALAKARIGASTDTSEIAERAAQQERERLAKQTQSSGPQRSASTTKPTSKTEDQARLDRFSDGWRD